MPFKPDNKIRKCKWCSNPPKVNYYGIKRLHKGYLRTCGSEECLKAQHRDLFVKRSKSYALKGVHEKCLHCQKDFIKGTYIQKWCKSCAPDKKSRAILQRYGMNFTEWNEMFLEQKGKCLLCSKPAVVVDHDHSTGEVRGLLCHGCNLLVGLLERDANWVGKAFNYIQTK